MEPLSRKVIAVLVVAGAVAAGDVAVVATHRADDRSKKAEQSFVDRQLQADGLPTYVVSPSPYPTPTQSATTVSFTGEVDLGLTAAGAPAPGDWSLSAGGTCTGKGVMAVVRENATVVVSDTTTHAVLARTTLGPGYEEPAASGVTSVCDFGFGFDGLPIRTSYTFQVAGLEPVVRSDADIGVGQITIDAYH